MVNKYEGLPHQVSRLAQKYGPRAIQTLVAIMESDDAPSSARVSAANSLLDRAYGRAPVKVQVEDVQGESAELIRQALAAREHAQAALAAPGLLSRLPPGEGMNGHPVTIRAVVLDADGEPLDG